MPRRDDADSLEPRDAQAIATQLAARSESTILIEHEVIDERTGLLRTTDRMQGVKRNKKASSWWILPPAFVFALLMGAGTTVEIEVIGQIACRAVAARDPTMRPLLSPPASLLWRFGSFAALPGTPEEDWMAKCRASHAVQKSSTELITSIMLAGGILSAVLAGWWGQVSDRHGRRPVLAVTSLAEFVGAAVFFAVLAFPHALGTKMLIFGAVLEGLAGGQANGMSVMAAYLGDLAVEGSKTKLLSVFMGIYTLGVGVGPIFGSFLLQQSAAGVFLIYGAQMLARAIYLVLIPFMPESLPRSMRTHLRPDPTLVSSSSSAASLANSTKRPSLLMRLAKVPTELLRPFKVLLPKVKEEGTASTATTKLDWRLTLVAISYTFAMVVPGMAAVKILFARGKYSWGPIETGHWITYTASIRVVLLVIVVPFIVKYLRMPIPLPDRPRPTVDLFDPTNEEAVLAWDVEAAKLKKTADTAFDLSLTRWTSIVTIVGYLTMSLPFPTSRNFLVGTALTAPAAVTIPSLQSLALATSAPDDAGKVLACLSALATLTSSTVGPSLFAAVYVWSVDWFAELVFVVAAGWVLLSAVPLFLVKIKRSRVVLAPRED